MGIVDEILKALDRIPTWKRLEEVPSEFAFFFITWPLDKDDANAINSFGRCMRLPALSASKKNGPETHGAISFTFSDDDGDDGDG